jgi:hypothetical protein
MSCHLEDCRYLTPDLGFFSHFLERPLIFDRLEVIPQQYHFLGLHFLTGDPQELDHQATTHLQ